MRNGIKAVVFDMGGVLIRSDLTYTRKEAMYEALSKKKLSRFFMQFGDVDSFVQCMWNAIDVAYFQNTSTWQPDAWDVFKRACEAFAGSAVPFTILSEYFWTYLKHLRKCLVLKPETKGVLKECGARGYRMALISNVFHPAIIYKETFTKWGIYDYFSPLIFSSDFHVRKPDPRIFQLALSKLPGIAPEECLFIGDIYEIDVVGSHASGMKPIWLHGKRSSENLLKVREIYNLTEILDII
jgi:epoxide hydrolase-like predicted phosphatase